MNDHDTKDTEQNMRIIAACRKKVEACMAEDGTTDNTTDDAKMALLLASVDLLVGDIDSTSVRDLHFTIGQLRHWGFGR